MKKIITILFAGIIASQNISAQNVFPATGSAGIGTAAPNASSLLEMVSTSKGLLIPRMTVAQRNAIVSPATGLMIYQTNNTPGFYYYSGTAWNAVSPKSANTALSNLLSPTAVSQSLLPGVSNSIDLGSSTKLWKNAWFSGDANINGLTVGTGSGSVPFNTAIGSAALFSNTTGTSNSAIGYNTLRNNTTGYYNTASGAGALATNTTGYFNTANGASALFSNTTGINNAATGYGALFSNTQGNDNTASGFEALHNNAKGHSNIAIGTRALYSNINNSNLIAIGDSALYNYTLDPQDPYIIVSGNIAIGSKSLFANTTGYANTAVGYTSLFFNTAGYHNTAIGFGPLFSNTTGYYNTLIGDYAAEGNTAGNYNTGTGVFTLGSNKTGSENTASGMSALYSSWGNNNSAFGSYADVVGAELFINNATAIGSGAIATSSNQVMLGNTSITSVKAAGSFVIYSDGRFKKNLKENVPGLAFINQLKPVTYNYDIHKLNDYIKPVTNAVTEKDKAKITANPELEKIKEDAIAAKEKKVYTGFVAQDVEKVADKMGYDFSGVYKPQNDKDPYGLSYADFVVPLVKAVQELSKANDALQQQNTDLEKRMQQLEAMMNVKSSATASAQTVKINSAALEQNIPNPFNHSTTINYTLPQQYSNAKIVITDHAGKSIKEINIIGKTKGSVTVDASSLSSGTYYYSLYADGKMISSKQMVLAK